MKTVRQAREQYETAIVIPLKCRWLVPRNVFILENIMRWNRLCAVLEDSG